MVILKRGIFLLFILLISFSAFSKSKRMHISNDFSLTFNDVYGPGSTSAVLTDGTTFNDNFNFRLKKAFSYKYKW